MRFNNVLFLVLLLFSLNNYGQSITIKNSIAIFSQNYNIDNYEKIYNSFSIKMQNAHSKKYYIDFFRRLKSKYGNLKYVEFLKGKISKDKGNYNGFFENGNVMIWISVNQSNFITGLYFKDYNDI